MPKKSNPWTVHVSKVFKDGKKKNSNYTFTQALKDAKKTYKKN